MEQKLLSYPLNDTPYTAEDARLFTATRTSGVFTDDRDFAVAPVLDEPVTLTVQPGIGWIRHDDFGGFVFANKSDVKLKLQTAHPTLTRIDRVIVRYDVAENGVYLIAKPGEPSSEPEGAELQRDAEAWELCVAEVMVTPNTVILSAFDISDTRLDEGLCGLMRDGVTRIPTQTLYNQWFDWFSRVVNDTGGGLGGLPEEFWLYALFPDELPPLQVEHVEQNPGLMEIFEASRFNKVVEQADAVEGTSEQARAWNPQRVMQTAVSSQRKRLIATLTTSGVFDIASYTKKDGSPLAIGDEILLYLVGGGASGRGGRGGGAGTSGGYGNGGNGGNGGAGGFANMFSLVLTRSSYAYVIGAGGPTAAGGVGSSTTATGGDGSMNGGGATSFGGLFSVNGGAASTHSGAGAGGSGGGSGGNGNYESGVQGTQGGTGGANGGGAENYMPTNSINGIVYGDGGTGGSSGGGGYGATWYSGAAALTSTTTGGSGGKGGNAVNGPNGENGTAGTAGLANRGAGGGGGGGGGCATPTSGTRTGGTGGNGGAGGSGVILVYA